MQAFYPLKDSGLTRTLPSPLSGSLQRFGGFTDYSSSSYYSRKNVTLPSYYTAQSVS